MECWWAWLFGVLAWVVGCIVLVVGCTVSGRDDEAAGLIPIAFPTIPHPMHAKSITPILASGIQSQRRRLRRVGGGGGGCEYGGSCMKNPFLYAHK